MQVCVSIVLLSLVQKLPNTSTITHTHTPHAVMMLLSAVSHHYMIISLYKLVITSFINQIYAKEKCK